MEWYEQALWKWREDRNHEALNYGGYCERDSQKQRCYDAERQSLIRSVGKIIPNIADVQDYVDRLCLTEWFVKRFGAGWTIEVIDHTRGRRWAWGSHRGGKSGRIKLPEGWARCEAVILHELAHAITPHTTGGRHGRYWARTFLELVRFRMGLSAYNALKAMFKGHRVKHGPKRPVSAISPQCAAARKAHAYTGNGPKVLEAYGIPKSCKEVCEYINQQGHHARLRYDVADRCFIWTIDGIDRDYWGCQRLSDMDFAGWLKSFLSFS